MRSTSRTARPSSAAASSRAAAASATSVSHRASARDRLDRRRHLVHQALRRHLAQTHELAGADHERRRIVDRVGQTRRARARTVRRSPAAPAPPRPRPPGARTGWRARPTPPNRAPPAPPPATVPAAHHRPNRRARCRRESVPGARAASRTRPPASAMPSIGTSAIGRSVSTSRRLNAIATGSDDSLATSTTVMPPASAHEYTVCTTSPPGTRSRVSVTGVPSTRSLSHRRLVPRHVPAVVGRHVPVERRRAVPRLDPHPTA